MVSNDGMSTEAETNFRRGE